MLQRRDKPARPIRHAGFGDIAHLDTDVALDNKPEDFGDGGAFPEIHVSQ